VTTLKTDFSLIRKLGQGGFGETSLVERDGDRYVLKRLKKSAIKDHGDTAVKMFLQESKYLEELGNHPQIPALIDSGVDIDGSWILQEYIPGENLEQVIGKQIFFSEAEIIILLKSLLPVLKVIHEKQAIHRDVKPANIIFHDERYYLVDFGASKHVSETVLRKTGTTIGSAGYAAPEQTMGKAIFASDIYSLGVTCIHLLTGMQPFDLIDMGTGLWCWQDYLSKPVSEGLELILDKMLEMGTHRRYQSAEKVLEALNRIDRRAIARRRLGKVTKGRRNRLVLRWGMRVVIGGGIAVLVVAGGYGMMQLRHLIPPPEHWVQSPGGSINSKNSLPTFGSILISLIKFFGVVGLLLSAPISVYKYTMEEYSGALMLLAFGVMNFFLTNSVLPLVTTIFISN
jgi:serine/threonine protein kinase